MLDRDALAGVLEAQPEVTGCAERGWSRLDPAGGNFEPLAALVINAQGTLEVSTANEVAGETTRWWLERIAGEYVTHEIGQVSLEEASVARARGRGPGGRSLEVDVF